MERWARTTLGEVETTWHQVRPWSVVLRLTDGAGVHRFLKHSPHYIANEVAALDRLAPSGLVPSVVARSMEHAAFIMEDHRAKAPETAPEIERVLEGVASLEASCVAPRYTFTYRSMDAVDTFDRFAAFVGSPRPLAPDEPDDELADQWRWSADMMARGAPHLRERVAAVHHLPPTLAHGDLHPSNTGIRSDGPVVVADWADSSGGPAGTGLATMLDPFELAETLKPSIHADDANPVASYIRVLVRNGYSTERELRRGLTGAALLGLARSALDLVPYSDTCDVETTRFVLRRCASIAASALVVGLGLSR